jgi:hypothetical protein
LCPSNFVIQPLHRLRVSSAARCISFAFGNSSVQATDFGRYFAVFFAPSSRTTLVNIESVLQPLLLFACLVSSNAQAIAPTRRPLGAGSVRASGSRAICECDLRGLYCVPNDSVLQSLQSCMPALCAVASFCQFCAVPRLYFAPNVPVL